MRILLWHVHGSWTTSFVHGGHDYLLPVVPDRGPDGRGRARTWDWPAAAREVTPAELADEAVDVVVLQRPQDLELYAEWTGRRPGRDVKAVYVEHNTPSQTVLHSRHPLADQSVIPIVHVTHFNQLFWDNGEAPTSVIEHGIVDPGYRYTGELARVAVVVNDPVRRERAVGSDLLAGLAGAAPLDVFGMNVTGVVDRWPDLVGRVETFEDLPQEAMHAQLARRRVYVHTSRWTSLGLSLLEAMHLGLPVVVLAATEAPRAVPPGTGVLSTRPGDLAEAVAELVGDVDRARETGLAARAAALDRYGLQRFLADWDHLLTSL